MRCAVVLLCTMCWTYLAKPDNLITWTEKHQGGQPQSTGKHGHSAVSVSLTVTCDTMTWNPMTSLADDTEGHTSESRRHRRPQ
jgi:hypothetical protein